MLYIFRQNIITRWNANYTKCNSSQDFAFMCNRKGVVLAILSQYSVSIDIRDMYKYLCRHF